MVFSFDTAAGDESRIEIPVTAGNWTGYGSVVLDATNTSREPVAFSIEVWDRAGAATAGKTWWDSGAGREGQFFIFAEFSAARDDGYVR